MAVNKTIPTAENVEAFIEAIADPARRGDAQLLIDVMTEGTGEQPTMWGASIVGFGRQRLRYESGRELEYFAVGFAPRKSQTVLYLTGGFDDLQDLLPRLGKHSTGKGCLNLSKVGDADPTALRELFSRSWSTAPGATT